MDPLSITASLIALLQISGTVISVLYEYRNGVKSASTDAARIITELNSLRGILESLLQAVGKEDSRTVPGGDGSSRLANFEALTRPAGELKQCEADLEAVSMKLGGDDPASLSGWKRAKKALVWPFIEKDVEKLLQSVQKAKSTMQLALSADQTNMTLEIHDSVNDIAQQITASTLDRRRQRIRDWLSATDRLPNHAAAKKKRHPLTGGWFLNGELYKSWMSSPGSLLWLYGIPGAGKSILCSSIIDDLLGRQANRSLAVAFYYFDFNDVGRKDTPALIRALGAQLLDRLPNESNCLEVLYSQIDNKQPDIDLLLETIQAAVFELDQVYIVVDALDECEDCEELMKLVLTMKSWDYERLHILVASRQLPEIQEVLADCATSSICLQNSVNQDIHMLIKERLNTDRKFQKWPPQVRDEIDETLTTGSNGMFRWVVCQLDMLRNCITLPALRKALRSLPKTLDETYERILANIDESYASDVRKLLQFLTFSPRAMTLAELVEVLAVNMDAEEPYFDPEDRIPEPKDILTMCSTLLTSADIMRYSPSTDRRLDTWSTIRLAHFSVKEYLLSERIRTSKASTYSMDPTSGNLFIAQTYLVYLLSPPFAGGPCGWPNTKTRSRAYPLFRAAVILFPIHIKTVDEHIDAKTKQLIQKLFSTRNNANGGNYAAWVEGLILNVKPSEIVNVSHLYYSASFGMTSIVRMLLEDMPKSEVDIKGGRAHSTPLHVACFRGQVECVKLLLEAGADPNSTNKRGESCLYWAYSAINPESEEIYDLLIKYGAEDDELRGGYSSDGGNAGMLSVHAQLESSVRKGWDRNREQILIDMMATDHYEKEYTRLEKLEEDQLVDVRMTDGTILNVKASEIPYT